MDPERSPWIVCTHARPAARLRLFCIPHAGTGASVFNRWVESFPAEIEVNAVQLPGHETRISETPFTRLGPLLTALGEAMLDRLDRPFALFGHSMGALVGFELTRLLRRDFRLSPTHLFLSGLRPVHLPDTDPPLHTLDADAALRELSTQYGAPATLLEDPELQRLMLPLIRADFEVCETYEYRHEEPLDCPVSVFGGTRDPRVSHRDLIEWQRHASTPITLRLIDGGHSLMESAAAEVAAGVLEQLCGRAERPWPADLSNSR